MAVFLSTFSNKLDKKGRVSVPAPFRSALENQNFQGLVAFRSLVLPAIEAMGMDRMEKLSQHLDSMDLFSQEQEELAAGIFADAQSLSFDGEGRILLPEILRRHAQIDDLVAFVGRGPTFQLWNPQTFALHQETCRQNLKSRPKISLGPLPSSSFGSSSPL